MLFYKFFLPCANSMHQPKSKSNSDYANVVIRYNAQHNGGIILLPSFVRTCARLDFPLFVA